jgi:ferredoxin
MEYLLSGHSLVLDQALCNGCGRCEEVCPHAVFSINPGTDGTVPRGTVSVNKGTDGTVHRRTVSSVPGKAVIANRGNCMECGACRMNCPLGAIKVSSGVGCAAAIISAMRQKRGGSAEACSCG